MSIEYTIDIQLTELGFPEILQPRETSATETPGHSASSNPLPSPPGARKQRLLSAEGAGAAGAAKHTPNIHQAAVFPASPPSESLPCKSPTPARSLQDERAAGLSEPGADGGPEPADGARPMSEEEGGGRQGVPDGDAAREDGRQGVPDGDAARDGSTEVEQDAEDDSDDSEVSNVYEEEEVDEEEDYEEVEGLDNESSHSGDYHCSVCDLQLPSKFKLQDHMNLHTGARPYCCAECGKRFCQIYNYRVHLRTHTETKVDRLLCRVCLMGFASQGDLENHLSRTHFEDEFYECDLCKRVFTSLKACEYHVQLHKCVLDFVCKVCGRSFSSQKSLVRHRSRSCHRNFKCTDCTKTFTKKNALLKHSFSHLGLLPYTCIRCRCHFRLAKLYRQHKCEPERIHCVACLREFLSQEDFQQHKKDTGCWGNQEPKGDEIRCLECGQRFDSSEELKQHAGAHQRVLKCAECGKGFRSALLLMSHMGGHAGKSPCLCQSCGLGFPHQQNYDSHLKTCGQTPQPASAPKKRQASKSYSSETKKLNAKPDSSSPAKPNSASPAIPDSPSPAKPDSSSPASTVTMPAAVSNHAAAPVKDSVSPGLVTESASTGSGPSDGLWKLTLDKQPPPGVKLVLFLPVCPTETNGLPLPSTVHQALPVPGMQFQQQVGLQPVSSNGHLGANAALGVLLNTPLDLVTGIKQDPECEGPLDLSKKSNSSRSALGDIPLLPIKNEPEEFKISGEALNSTEREEFKSSDSKAILRRHPGEADAHTEMKQLKMAPSPLSTPPRLIMDIKEEIKMEKEIKMDVDVSTLRAEENE